ncbi:unnamed protein product, partial [Phaeothamnion confervicola]
QVFQCLRAGAVPIYWGAPNVNAFVPPGSVIQVGALQLRLFAGGRQKYWNG